MAARDGGSNWMLVNVAAVRFPTGNGGVTATATSALTLNKHVILDGLLVLQADSTGRTITLLRHDGTTTILAIDIAANQACPLYIPLGGENGMDLGMLGISAATGNVATNGVLFFRIAP